VSEFQGGRAAPPGGHPGGRLIPLALAAFLVAGLIVFLVLPHLAAKPHARYTRCASNLKQIGYACELWSAEHAGAFPGRLGELYPTHASDPRVFVCPFTDVEFLPYSGMPIGEIPDKHKNYCYASGLRVDDPSNYVLAWDEEWNHQGRGVHVLHVDRSVDKRLDIQRMHEELAEQKKELAVQGRTMHIIRPAWSRWPERPEYPVTPLRERPHVIALVAGSGIALAALTALLAVRRRRRRACENQT